MATHIQPSPSFLAFSWKTYCSSPHTFSLEPFSTKSSQCGRKDALIMQWTKGWIDSAVVEGHSLGQAFNITRSSVSLSSSALPAETYLSWLSCSNSPLGLWLSHLAQKTAAKTSFVLQGRERNSWCVLTGKHYPQPQDEMSFLCQGKRPLIGRQTCSAMLEKGERADMSFPHPCQQNTALILFHIWLLIGCVDSYRLLKKHTEESSQHHDLI